MSAEIVTITSPASGDYARVLVSQGFNCFEYRVNCGGQTVDALWSLPNFASGHQRPSSSGIPLLFPFPGRIPGTSFSWNGRTFELEPGDKFGNAIHGFCHTRPWRIIDQQDDSVTGEFQASIDDPSLLARWPSDFKITANYAIGAGVLACNYEFANPGEQPLPCGFGAHPYFRLPLGGASANDCVVQLPVTKQWELVEMLPTGALLDWPGAAASADGVKFEKLQLDDVFAGLTFAGERCTATVFDPSSQRRLTIAWDKTFRECVVFTPPHREAICIEPYTCVPGAIALHERGIEAGLRVLQPGESFSARMEIRVS
ncbi:MAG TPA: aldose 1-epimerase [Pirellulaceae bacterium]|nr:aldose 1-epimerase [Pirellulaceae bacterium]